MVTNNSRWFEPNIHLTSWELNVLESAVADKIIRMGAEKVKPEEKTEHSVKLSEIKMLHRKLYRIRTGKVS